MQSRNLLIKLCLLALFIVSVVIVLGAFTRLVHAGLGCPDWPTCYGHLWVPNETHEIATANALFQDTPVETNKTWPEQIHRLFASSLGVVILIIFAIALRTETRTGATWQLLAPLGLLVIGVVARVFIGAWVDPFLWVVVALYFGNIWRLSRQRNLAGVLLPAILAGLVIVQGFFGMWTVTLKLWPQVVTAHLLGGFATLSVIWLMLQTLAPANWQVPAHKMTPLSALSPIAFTALVAVVIQITLGGWTSSNYAALACPDFPYCQDAVIPNADFRQGFNVFQQMGPNYLGGLLDNQARIAIHFSHRLGALLVLGLNLWLLFGLWRSGVTQAKKSALILAAVLSLQIGLGISNVVMNLPLVIAVAHNAGGALLLLVLITINHRLRTAIIH